MDRIESSRLTLKGESRMSQMNPESAATDSQRRDRTRAEIEQELIAEARFAADEPDADGSAMFPDVVPPPGPVFRSRSE